MQKASNEGAFFVLPSQLNGVDSPSAERVLKSLEECKLLGQRCAMGRAVAASIPMHTCCPNRWLLVVKGYRDSVLIIDTGGTG